MMNTSVLKLWRIVVCSFYDVIKYRELSATEVEEITKEGSIYSKLPEKNVTLHPVFHISGRDPQNHHTNNLWYLAVKHLKFS